MDQAVEYCKQEFKLGFGPNSVREQLLAIERQTGRTPKELLELIELPESCYDTWYWFLDLHNARDSNGMSINPISYTEIKNYFELIQVVPDEWEVKLIKRFDMQVMNYFAEESKKKSNKKPRK